MATIKRILKLQAKYSYQVRHCNSMLCDKCFFFYAEQRIKKIIKLHCDQFVQYSNWNSLLPHLEAVDLLDPDTKEKLMSNVGCREKSNYFYMTALPSQGKDAYTRFYKSLMKENEHAGHKTLQDLLS